MKRYMASAGVVIISVVALILIYNFYGLEINDQKLEIKELMESEHQELSDYLSSNDYETLFNEQIGYFERRDVIAKVIGHPWRENEENRGYGYDPFPPEDKYFIGKEIADNFEGSEIKDSQGLICDAKVLQAVAVREKIEEKEAKQKLLNYLEKKIKNGISACQKTFNLSPDFQQPQQPQYLVTNFAIIISPLYWAGFGEISEKGRAEEPIIKNEKLEKKLLDLLIDTARVQGGQEEAIKSFENRRKYLQEN